MYEKCKTEKNKKQVSTSVKQYNNTSTITHKYNNTQVQQYTSTTIHKYNNTQTTHKFNNDTSTTTTQVQQQHKYNNTSTTPQATKQSPRLTQRFPTVPIGAVAAIVAGPPLVAVARLIRDMRTVAVPGTDVAGLAVLRVGGVVDGGFARAQFARGSFGEKVGRTVRAVAANVPSNVAVAGTALAGGRGAAVTNAIPMPTTHPHSTVCPTL